MRVWRVSSFLKIKPARPAALKHQAQTRQNQGGSAGLAGLAGLRVLNLGDYFIPKLCYN